MIKFVISQNILAICTIIDLKDDRLMLITMECDYAIRTIRALAGGEKLSVATICAAEHIPSQYAYKILKKLQHAGFVESHRGCDGGYILIKPLDEFTLYDVVSALGKNLYLIECLTPGHSCARNSNEAPCSVHCELRRIHDMMISELASKTMMNVLNS